MRKYVTDNNSRLVSKYIICIKSRGKFVVQPTGSQERF